MRRARRAAALVAVLAVAGGCSVPAVFPCQVDSECRVGETQGRCEPAGYCSLPDGDCESGYRFVEESPGSIAGECVEEDGGGGCDVDPEAPGCSEEVGCAVAIASGAAHSCAIDQAGDVWCWGDNGEMRLGSSGGATEEPRQVTGLAGPVDLVAAGGTHSCAVVDGQVTCWGANDAGQLGRGATGSAALAGEAVEDVTGVHALGTGDRHTCVSDFDDTVYCWGDNGDDQVNEGDGAVVTSPTEVSGILQCATGVVGGARHSAAVFEDGVVRTWGEADSPALGRGDVATPGYAEIVVDSFDARSVTAGAAHTCGLGAGGEVYCWGESDDGRLGLADGGGDESAPVEITAQGNADEVSAGGRHTCARLGGAVRCWGANDGGQLGVGGDGGPEARAVPGTWSAVAAGGSHTCAIASTGAVYCWGGGDAGNGGSSEPRRVALPCD